MYPVNNLINNMHVFICILLCISSCSNIFTKKVLSIKILFKDIKTGVLLYIKNSQESESKIDG